MLACIVDVEQANGFTVLLQFVFHLRNNRQRLGPGQINAAILQLAGIQHSHGNEPARFGVSLVSGKLQYGDRAQFRAVFAVLGHLAGILRNRRQGGQNPGSGNQRHTCFQESIRLAQ